jgi:toxin ParE1/3/4
MSRVLRSSLAERDLEEIWAYIARDNPAAASRVIRAIAGKCQLMAMQPELGELRPELAPRLRSFLVGNYVVVYWPMSDGIEIARVIHAARDIQSLF